MFEQKILFYFMKSFNLILNIFCIINIPLYQIKYPDFMFTPRSTSFRSRFHSPASTTDRVSTTFKQSLKSARLTPYNIFYQFSQGQPTQRTVDCQNCQKCQHIKRMEELEKACRKYDQGYLKKNRGFENGQKEKQIDISRIISKQKAKQGSYERNQTNIGAASGHRLYAQNKHGTIKLQQNNDNSKNRQQYYQGKVSQDGRWVYDFKINNQPGAVHPTQTFTLYEVSPVANSIPPSRFPQSQQLFYASNKDNLDFLRTANTDIVTDAVRDIFRSERINELSEARNAELKMMMQGLQRKQNLIENKIDGWMSGTAKQFQKYKEDNLQTKISRQLEEFKEREQNILREFERMKLIDEMNRRDKMLREQIQKEKQKQIRLQRQRFISLQSMKQKQKNIQKESMNIKQIQLQKQKQTQIQIQKQKQIQNQKTMQAQIQLHLQQQQELLQQREHHLNKLLLEYQQAQKRKYLQAEKEKQLYNQRELQKQREWEAIRQADQQLFKHRQIQMRNQLMNILNLEKQKLAQHDVIREQQRQAALQNERELMMMIEKERESRKHRNLEHHENSSLIDLSSQAEEIIEQGKRAQNENTHNIATNLPLLPTPHPSPVLLQQSQLTQSNLLIKRIYQDIQEWNELSFQSNDSVQFRRKMDALFGQADEYNRYLNNHPRNQQDRFQIQKVNQLITIRNDSVSQGTKYLDQFNALIASMQQNNVPMVESTPLVRRSRT